MTTRTKMGVCVGLFTLAVGVAWVLNLPPKPRVELSFVRYYEDGAAVLTLTNRGQSIVQCFGLNVTTLSRRRHFAPWFFLMPQNGTQFVVYAKVSKPSTGNADLFLSLLRTSDLPATASLQCVPGVPKLRLRIESLLIKVGINIRSTGFVATVTLPPRGSNAPAQPVTP